MPTEWNAHINNFDERIKPKMEEAALKLANPIAALANPIAALNLGSDIEGKPLENLCPLEYINNESEDNYEVEYSTRSLCNYCKMAKRYLIPWL